MQWRVPRPPRPAVLGIDFLSRRAMHSPKRALAHPLQRLFPPAPSSLPLIVALVEEKFLGIGTRRLVGDILRGVLIGIAPRSAPFVKRYAAVSQPPVFPKVFLNCSSFFSCRLPLKPSGRPSRTASTVKGQTEMILAGQKERQPGVTLVSG